jgi:Tfp pilus assembly protein PilX
MSSVHSGAPRETQSARPREGFALPLAIMVLALLSIVLIAGFAMSTGEQAATSSQRAQARAYSYAQMGLEAFLTNRKEFTQSSCVPPTPYTAAQAATAVTSTGAPCAFCPQCWAANAAPMKTTVNANLDTLPTLPESVTVSFANGRAYIQAVPVWLDVPNGRGTYFVRSTGTDNTSGIATGSNGMRTATRTVGVYVTWSKSTMNVLGALVSFSGVIKNGTGAVSGVDGCSADTNVAGITVPAEESVALLGGASGFMPTGNPPYDTLQTFAQDSANSRLDWKGIRDGTSIIADITLTTSTSFFPSTGTFSADTNYWPVIHVKNHDTSAGGWNSMWGLTNKGRGILIVDGDLDINGSNQWDGIVLVGGQLSSNGNNVTSGTVMAGLNRLLGEDPGAVDDASLNGTKSYVYNSCAVRKASSSMARYNMVPNTWMDNLAQY